MNKVKILVIPPDGGVGFYRSIQPHIQLEKQFPERFSITFNANPDFGDLDYFKKFDMVHVQRGLFENINLFTNTIKELKKLGIKTILDIDDYWSLNIDHPYYQTYKRQNLDDIIKNNISMFDYVLTPTEIFANEIRKYNKNVFVIPNSIDPEDDRFIINRKDSERLRIGMILGASHENDVDLISGITEILTPEELSKVQFVLCGFDLRGMMAEVNPITGEITKKPMKPYENVWYRYEKMFTSDYKIISDEYKQFLHRFIPDVEYPNIKNEPYKRCWTKSIDDYYKHYENIDVLLIPLANTEFNKMKSQLKVVEAGFSHTAVIASNYGPYTIDLKNVFERGGVINKHGNALLVDTGKNSKNWVRFIKMLIKDRNLVKTLQDNLYETVHEKYDLKNVTKERAEIYNKIIN